MPVLMHEEEAPMFLRALFPRFAKDVLFPRLQWVDELGIKAIFPRLCVMLGLKDPE